MQTPEGFWSRFKIDVRTHYEVTSINRDKRNVTVTDKASGEVFEESCDKLILSPGGKPFMPDFCKGGFRLYGTMYNEKKASKSAYDCGMEK